MAREAPSASETRPALLRSSSLFLFCPLLCSTRPTCVLPSSLFHPPDLNTPPQLEVEAPYFDSLLNSLQHEATATQLTMAPPPSLASALHRSVYCVNYARGGLASSSNVYPDPVNHLWQPPGNTFPFDSSPSGLDLGNHFQASKVCSPRGKPSDHGAHKQRIIWTNTESIFPNGSGQNTFQSRLEARCYGKSIEGRGSRERTLRLSIAVND
jgi:hypothetical protein